MRRLRFFLRWVFFYNIELVWLSWRLPRDVSLLPSPGPRAEKLRRRSHVLFSRITADCGSVCGKCGRCCLETIDRFTPFDYAIRQGTESPAPSWDRRIYSVPWMIWNTILHTLQKLMPKSRRPKPQPCPHLSPQGCSLKHELRPMICVSWFCPQIAMALDNEKLKAAETPLRIIEAIHRETVRLARAPRSSAVSRFEK